jgi:glycosyltransferase involved in cell wall biosynthesis
MTDQRPLVSIVCPAYHEQDVLPLFHDELSWVLSPLQEQYQFEILYIDDGSRDRTLATMQAIGQTDHRVRVLSLARNFGKEAALQAGLEHAEGDLIITMDTDLQHPPELIPQLLEKSYGAVDLVITVREEYQKPGWFNQLGTQTFYRILDALSEIKIRKETSDYLLMNRKVANVLLQMQEKHRFMKGLIHWMGFSYAEVPFKPMERTVGTTKFSFFRLLALGKDCLFAFSKKPLTLASSLGTIALLLGVAWAVFALVQLLSGDANWAAHYLIVSSHVLAGAILLSIGILGEYLGRIWEQVKSRPNYLLKYDSHESVARKVSHQSPHIKVFEAAAEDSSPVPPVLRGK